MSTSSPEASARNRFMVFTLAAIVETGVLCAVKDIIPALVIPIVFVVGLTYMGALLNARKVRELN